MGRKAERSGLSVEFGGIEMLDEFYGFFAARMHDLGSPVHAREFFPRHARRLREPGPRRALVWKGQTPIGGLIALAFKDASLCRGRPARKSISRSVPTCCCTGRPFARLR
jgi:hypothetical protein